MRRNRRVKQQSRAVRNSGRLALLIAVGFIIGVIYIAQTSRCASLQQDIAAENRRLKALDDELVRENRRFNAMVTPEKLGEALNRFGLKMDYPVDRQLVRMDRRGKPLLGQLSLKTHRKEESKVVKVSERTPSAAAPSRRRTKIRR